MQNALKRLLELRQELEQLHETTARVLAESEALISQISSPAVPPGAGVNPPRPSAPRQSPRTAKKAAVRRRK